MNVIERFEQTCTEAGRDVVHRVLDELEAASVEVGRLRSLPYDEYLRTDHWREKRCEALQRAEGACQLCASTKRLQVHHRSYERLGFELPADLTVLCADCHGSFHGR